MFASINDIDSMKNLLYPNSEKGKKKRNKKNIKRLNINAFDSEQYTALYCAEKNKIGCI